MGIVCDSHVHVVGDLQEFPWVAGRTYTAPARSVDDLRAAAPGVGRFVVVQPSFYGTDNRVTLSALQQLGPAGRGVAVIDPSQVSAAELAAMHAAGIRGLRINLYSQLSTAKPDLGQLIEPTRAVAARMGWHIQVIAHAETLAGNAALLADAAVPLVLDHYGLPGASPPGSQTGRALLALARQPHVWVKLSAPYRVDGVPLSTRPPAAWLEALLDAAPDRCVWGSDWPHTPDHLTKPGESPPHLAWRSIPYAALLDGFRSALPPSACERVLCANPARLYDFASA